MLIKIYFKISIIQHPISDSLNLYPIYPFLSSPCYYISMFSSFLFFLCFLNLTKSMMKIEEEKESDNSDDASDEVSNEEGW